MARWLTAIRALSIPPFLWLLVEASHGVGEARFGLVLLFVAVLLSDYWDGRLARAAGTATAVWGVIDVCADVAFNVAALGVAAALGLIGPQAAAGVAVLGAAYVLRVFPSLIRPDRAPAASYDRLGHAAGVSFYVLVGLVVGHVAVGVPGGTWLEAAADGVFAYAVLVLGVRAWSFGKRSA